MQNVKRKTTLVSPKNLRTGARGSGKQAELERKETLAAERAIAREKGRIWYENYKRRERLETAGCWVLGILALMAIVNKVLF